MRFVVVQALVTKERSTFSSGFHWTLTQHRVATALPSREGRGVVDLMRRLPKQGTRFVPYTVAHARIATRIGGMLRLSSTISFLTNTDNRRARTNMVATRAHQKSRMLIGRPLEEASRPVVNGLMAHLAPRTRPETPTEVCDPSSDGVFIAQAEMRALEATNARMAQQLIDLERENQELRGDASKARIDKEAALERERRCGSEARQALRDAQRSSSKVERAEAECRQLRADLEKTQALAEATSMAKKKTEEERRSIERQLHTVEARLEAALGARRAVEARLAEMMPVAEWQALEHRAITAESREAQVREALNKSRKALADAQEAEERACAAEAEARSAAEEAKEALDKARRAHRRELALLERPLLPAKQGKPARKGGFGRFTTINDEPTTDSELRRLLQESRQREKLSHRRSEQLGERLKTERERSGTAEAMVRRLQTNLDRALKAAKHERTRCSHLKKTVSRNKGQNDEDKRSGFPPTPKYVDPVYGPQSAQQHNSTDNIPIAFRDSFDDDDTMPSFTSPHLSRAEFDDSEDD